MVEHDDGLLEVVLETPLLNRRSDATAWIVHRMSHHLPCQFTNSQTLQTPRQSPRSFRHVRVRHEDYEVFPILFGGHPNMSV